MANPLIRFLKGSRTLNLPRSVTVPTWDLPTVLSPPFEPLQSVDLRLLMLKTALLLALASVKHLGNMQALSVSPSCLEFGPNDTKIVLKSRHGYIPKVLSTQSAGDYSLGASYVGARPGFESTQMPSTFARFYNLEVPGLTLSHDNQYGQLPSSVHSWPSIELRGCTDLFGTITQGWVDLDEFGALLGPSGPLLVSKDVFTKGKSDSSLALFRTKGKKLYIVAIFSRFGSFSHHTVFSCPNQLKRPKMPKCSHVTTSASLAD